MSKGQGGVLDGAFFPNHMLSYVAIWGTGAWAFSSQKDCGRSYASGKEPAEARTEEADYVSGD